MSNILTDETNSFNELREYILRYKHLISRTESMIRAVNIIEKRFKGTPITIVETGCQRAFEHGGDGNSTSVFARIAKITNSHLYTVDINPSNIQKCSKYTKNYSDYITYTVDDSINFLQNFDKTINFLYLDSFDTGHDAEMRAACNHQLGEAVASLKNLTENSIILSDDAPDLVSGKVAYSVPFLLEKGFKILWNSVELGQVALSKTEDI